MVVFNRTIVVAGLAVLFGACSQVDTITTQGIGVVDSSTPLVSSNPSVARSGTTQAIGVPDASKPLIKPAPKVARTSTTNVVARVDASSPASVTPPRVVKAKPKPQRRQPTTVAPRGKIQALVAKHARRAGVPVSLALAVVHVESRFNPRARGRSGEIGLMQILPRTARGMGYRGKLSALYNPDTNIRWGMKYLARAYKLAGGSTCGTILRYNAGHYAKRMNPISRRYCKRVRSYLRGNKRA